MQLPVRLPWGKLWLTYGFEAVLSIAIRKAMETTWPMNAAACACMRAMACNSGIRKIAPHM